MGYSIPSLARLTEQFERMPGIGRKSAQRLAFHVLSLSDEEAAGFADAITRAKKNIHCCRICQNLTDSEVCSVCSDSQRDKTTVCVVEDAQDVIAFERTGEYRGLYHVLGGVISPLDGIGPEQLKIKELLMRLSDNTVTEVIMATNPTVDGEATSAYLSRLLKPLGIKVTRLAYGIPVGGNLEYADDVTLSRALDGRNEI